MKRHIILQIIQKIKSRPDLMRKAKIFAVIGVFGFLLTGGLIIWAGVTAFNFVSQQAQQIIQSPAAVNQMATLTTAPISTYVKTLKSTVQNIPVVQKRLDCWVQAQSFFAIQPWLERPVFENLQKISTACLGTLPTICIGPDCQKVPPQQEQLKTKDY